MRRDLLAPTLCAFAVEAIIRLWDRGHFVDEKWAVAIHATWFHHWVNWKARLTMQDVDAQVEQIHNLWDMLDEEDVARASEIAKGETPLGGPMQLSHSKLGTMEELNDNE